MDNMEESNGHAIEDCTKTSCSPRSSRDRADIEAIQADTW